jgi:predicted PurR-regulated permease PerM
MATRKNSNSGKQPVQSFTSLRIIGKKAQNLLQKAAEIRRKSAAEGTEVMPEPSSKEAELTVRFSLLSVAEATLMIILVLAAVWVAMILRETIILLLLGFFVAAVTDPGVRALERMGFPRGIGILLLYFAAAFIFIFLFVSLIPIVASQVQQIVFLLNDAINAFLQNPQIHLPLLTAEVNAQLTEFVRATLEQLSINKFTDALQIMGQNMSSIAQGSITAVARIVGGIGAFFVKLMLVLVFAFFIQMEKEGLRLWLRSFFTARYRALIDVKTEAIHLKIGQWARGQMLLGLAVGSLVFIALTILRVPYAATLAILAGFTEFIPYIGPFIAAVPAILISFTDGGWLSALIVTGVYYVIQLCENNLLVPLIMKRAVGLSPIAVLCAMLMGLSFPQVINPVLGVLLAVPVTTIIAIFLDDLRIIKKP